MYKIVILLGLLRALVG